MKLGRDLISSVPLAIYIMCIALFMLANCRAQDFTESSDEISVTPLAVPAAEYHSVAWLDEQHIAFSYRKTEFGDRDADRRIAILDLHTDEWQDISLPALPAKCRPAASGVSHLSRLPDGNLGFVLNCNNGGVSGELYSWNTNTEKVEVQQVYDSPFRVSYYTFSPDMKRLIQEDAEGPGLNNKLYRITPSGSLERLLTQFVRARSPSWSPNEDVIVFSGTKIEGEERGDLMTWDEIESLALHPWDLYLMNPDGSNVRILLSNAGRPYQIKWSPDGAPLLAYAGDYQNKQGLWMFDVDTHDITRVWQQNTFYDWSPDGQRMVIIEQDESGGTYPVIFDVPVE